MAASVGSDCPGYSPEIAQELLALIAGGMSLRKACQQPRMPSCEAWGEWRRKYPELVEQYARARAERAAARADEIIEIADDEAIPVESRKVRIDARKWEASKLDRANYGDRQQVEHSASESLGAIIARSFAPPKADG